MDIYNFEDFQKKIAKFSVSPYAEAITTLAGITPQVVGVTSRLASAYSSLRGTVQLLTTDEDNNIIDETTAERETIARSAVVSAWTNMGSSVERLISLRRQLKQQGVTKKLAQYPYEFTNGGDGNRAGNAIPSFIATGDINSKGFTIELPQGWKEYAPVAAVNTSLNVRSIRLAIRSSSNLATNIFATNPSKGYHYVESVAEQKILPNPTLGGNVINNAYLVLKDTDSAPTLDALYVEVLIRNSSNYSFSMQWHKIVLSGTMGSSSHTQLYSRSWSSAPSTVVSAAQMYDVIKMFTNPDNCKVSGLKVVQYNVPQPAEEEINFDPFDPREVFNQAYEAASAVLELLEAMGYATSLTQEDKELLTEP